MRNSSTKGFTLIEVLVSVVILAIVGVGLLQISINSKKNFEFLKEKISFDRLSSIAFTHNSNDLHNKDMTLFQFIEDNYDNIDDDIRKYLDSKKVTYRHESFSTLSLPGSNNEQNGSASDNGMDLTLIYEKITVFGKHYATFAYKIYLPVTNPGAITDADK